MVAIELRSNTMKSGFHDEKLMDASSEADLIFWKSEDFEQANGLVEKNPSYSSHISDVDAFVENFDSISTEGDILIVMSNGNFDDLSKKLIRKIQYD